MSVRVFDTLTVSLPARSKDVLASGGGGGGEGGRTGWEND